MLSLFAFICVSCSSSDGSTPEWYWKSGDSTADSSIVALGWKNVSSTYGTLPSYINLYKAPDSLQGKKAIAYIAVADLSKATFSVLGDST